MKRSHFLLSGFLYLACIVFSNQSTAGNPPELKAKVEQFTSQENQLGFQENKGQMADIYGRPASYVLFKAEIPNLNIWITTNGLTYQFFDLKEDEFEKEGEGDEKDQKVLDKNAEPASEEKIKCEWSRVDMILKGASIKKENISVEGDITNGDLSYYLGHCPQGIFNVRTYNKINIREIYPGIDWVLYTSSQGGIKHDFIVHPGSDPNQIKLIYEGNGKLDIKDNQIYFENKLGRITEGKLLCYQESESKIISSGYTLFETQKKINNGFSFQVAISLGQYDRSQSVVIDPQLVWSTFYGGSGTDGPKSIDADPAGNIFITGYVGSANFPVLNPGAPTYYQGTNSGPNTNENAFISKFSNVGVLIWSTYYGGYTNAYPASICHDPGGNVFITGYTWDTNLPVFNPLGGTYFQGTNAGGGDAFILKFTNTGQRLWATYYGGAGNDQGLSICSDPTGNIFVTGATASPNFPLLNPLGGAYFQGANAGGGDAFVLKFSNTGVQSWATYYGGSGVDGGFSICSDLAGNIFVTGRTASSNFPLLTPFQGANAGGNDAFIVKFSNTGVQSWATYYGGSGDDGGFSICSDLAGNIFVTGTTASPNFPLLNPLGGAYFQGTNAGGSNDAFILKFNNSGVRLWVTYYGGSGYESPPGSDHNIAADNCGNVYMSLETNSTDLYTFGNTSCGQYFDPSLNGVKDIFIVKFNNTGALLWATYFGGNGSDFRSPITVDNSGNLFATGEWNFNATTGYSLINPGGGTYYRGMQLGMDDGHIAKFVSVPLNLTTSSTGVACGGGTGAVAVMATCGSAPYSYSWSAWGQTTASVSGLSAGTYTVTVSDIGCLTATAVVTVGSTAGTIAILQNSMNVSCNGANNGSASVTTVGGAGPFTYSWSTIPVQTTANATGLGTGTYTLVVTNGAGCASTTTFTITQPAAITVTPTVVNTTCNKSNGSVSIVVSGGTLNSYGQYSYSWSPNVGTGSTGSLLSAGTYAITVSDANGCTKTSVNSVAPSAGPITTFTQSPGGTVCVGSIVNFTNTGTPPGAGVTYNWLISAIPPANVSGTTTDFSYTFLTAGTYTVTHTVATGGCTNNESSIITVINCSGFPVVTATGSSVCHGSCATVSSTASGGTNPYTYSWSNGATTQNINPCPVTTTTYTVTIRDSGGNTSTSTAVVTIYPLISVTATPSNISCSGDVGSVSATGTGGTIAYTYNWSSGQTSQTVTGLSAGIYSVTITDSKGCTSVSAATIISPAPLVGQFTKGAASCTGCGCKEWLMVSASGGTSPYSYAWPDGYVSRYKNQLCPGAYTINIKDKNGCSVNVSLVAP